MTHATCRLTAKNRDQLRNPTLGIRVWAIFTFYPLTIIDTIRYILLTIQTLNLLTGILQRSSLNDLYTREMSPGTKYNLIVCDIDVKTVQIKIKKR